MVKCYNCNCYGHYSGVFPNWSLSEGESNAKIVSNNTVSDNNNNNNNDAMDGGGEANTMLDTMYIYD